MDIPTLDHFEEVAEKELAKKEGESVRLKPTLAGCLADIGFNVGCPALPREDAPKIRQAIRDWCISVFDPAVKTDALDLAKYRSRLDSVRAEKERACEKLKRAAAEHFEDSAAKQKKAKTEKEEEEAPPCKV